MHDWTSSCLSSVQDEHVHIGTWNLAGRWSADHLQLLMDQDCDVWLLTEVREDVAMPGFDSHLTASKMTSRRHWAGVFCSSPLEPLPDPHPASAAALGMGLSWCSSILPWRSCCAEPWGEGTSREKTERALDQLVGSLTVGQFWGGDWNHAMHGPESAGSVAGRIAIKAAVAHLELKTVTEDSPHRIPGLLSIDHIAVPKTSLVHSVNRIIAQDQAGKRLSDHDAYTTSTTLT